MRKEQYMEVLETHVVPTMNNHATSHYLEDKAPCHTAKVCQDFKRVRIMFGGRGVVVKITSSFILSGHHCLMMKISLSQYLFCN